VFFVPLNLLIAATSILAFIAGESSVSNDNTTFNIVVGCLAAFGVFWNSCDRMLGYKSRADMHTGAKMVCKELLADLDFALIKFKSFSAEEKKDKENKVKAAEKRKKESGVKEKGKKTSEKNSKEKATKTKEKSSKKAAAEKKKAQQGAVLEATAGGYEL